ncbi:MAG: hypothetical protein RJA99_2700 [Pseudomonadota bacterium]|jgi:urease subunit beta
MTPGELLVDDGEIELNAGRPKITLTVRNAGDRPIQVGSHYHFGETNAALEFDREAARGFRLDIAAGTAVRFEPGQSRTVALVALAGARTVYGFRQMVMGPLDATPPKATVKAPARVPSKAPARARAAKKATPKAPPSKTAASKASTAKKPAAKAASPKKKA